MRHYIMHIEQTHTAGTAKPSALRRCFLASYVPLRVERSKSVPAMI